MAIAKVILNGVTQMDVTQKSVTAGSMLSGTTALKNDGTDITGNIESKTSSNLTASGATVTAPAGYYASAASKSVASGSAGTPTASKGTVSNHSVSVTPSVTNTTGYITGGTKTGTAVTVSASELVSGTKTISASGTTDVTNYESVSVPSGSAKTPATTITANPTVSVNSSGLITATVSKTQSVTPSVSAGYVASGTAGTVTVSGSGTNQLPTQGAQTIHPSTTDQTIASGKYLTGAQTIKAVTTTNLTAENIVQGVTVKVGDSTDDDCVASVTGTASGGRYVVTISGTGNKGACFVKHNGTYYYTNGDTFTYAIGDTLTCWVSYGDTNKLYVDDIVVAGGYGQSVTNYLYTLPVGGVGIELRNSRGDSYIKITTNEPTISITSNGTYDVYEYSKAEVNVSGGNDFIITLTRNAETGNWEPDCTFEEMYAAYTGGKMVRVDADYDVPCSIVITDSPSFYCTYMVTESYYDPVIKTSGINGRTFSWTSSGISNIENDTAYFTDNATATPEDVASGKVFYNADGYQTGTASGGSDEDYIAMIERTTAVTSLPSAVTKIGDYAFYYYTNLALTSLPSGITSIGVRAFQNCSSLALASLPSGITSIDTYAFQNCTNLALTSLPDGLTSLGSYAFMDCSSLALTSLPSGITTVPVYAFYNCYAITISSLPDSVTYIGTSAFSRCKDMTSISCNGTITTMGNNAFIGDNSHQMHIAHASFPNMAVSSLTTVFGSISKTDACWLLEDADIGNTAAIAANAFANCNKLQTLILRKTESICTLANVSAFLNTPMRGYNSLTGTIYVPSALISTYQTATNWSTIYGEGHVTFAAIEGSEYEL